MSTNDGHKLLVFGLSFAQHDNRKMQQVLRHYNRLPTNPGNRASLFVELNNVAKDLEANEAAQDQIHQLTEWMTNGGDFPRSISSSLLNAEAVHTRQGYSLSGYHRYYGRGRILSDAPEDGDQETNSSQLPANDGNNNHTYSAENSSRGISMRRYGRGRTINDPPETVDTAEGGEEDVDESTSQPGHDQMQNMHNGNQWGTTGAQNYYHYGQGRTLNDPPEPVSIDGDDNNFREAHGQHHENEDANMTESSTNTNFEIDRGLLEGGLGSEEVQLESVNIEPSGSADDRQYDSSMHPDGANDTDAIECPICLEDYPPSSFPKGPTVTESCDHPDKACLQCLDSSITVLVERGALHLLACPICPQKLSHQNIKEYANKEVYKRYQYLKQQSEIPGHWISCTNTDCGGSQPHESKDPKMICNHCKFATCANHKRPWHEGQTCGEFDLDDAQIERLEEEEATAKLLAKESTSICPKCGQGVTKTEGCDHMLCQCGTEWCYVCSCSWENILRIGETAHATFCIYHPNKVNLTRSQKEATRNRIMGLVHGGEVSAELAKARDELRQRRRVEIRAKALEAAEARMKGAMEHKRSAPQPQEKRKKRVKLVAPWEEGGRTKKAL